MLNGIKIYKWQISTFPLPWAQVWNTLLICMIIFGCQEQSETVGDRVEEGQRSTQINFELRLNLEFKSALSHLVDSNRALGIEMYALESGLLERREWLDYEIVLDAESSPERDDRLTVRPTQPLFVRPGTYRIHLFIRGEEDNLVERSGTPQSITCPQPFTLRSPLTKRALNLASASWEGRVQRDQELDLNFIQRTCGPGDLTTSLNGELLLPFHTEASVMDRLMLHLSPRSNAESVAPLTIPLRRYLRKVDNDRYKYSINQLPSGAFNLRVFVDSDGDSLPSPCDLNAKSGGDLWASSERVEVTLQRGEHLSIEEPLSVASVVDCQEIKRQEERSGQPIIYRGQIDLNDLLRTAIRFSSNRQVLFSGDRRLLSPYRFIYGTPLFNLQEAIIAEGRFSVHLDPLSNAVEELEMAELAIWIDESSDQVLTPCDDVADLGTDLWWWTGKRDRLSPTSLLMNDLDSRASELISISRRCDSPESVLEIDFQLNFTWPELSSARPLVLVYEDLLSGQIYESSLKDLSPLDMSSPLKVSRRVPAGAYLLSAYVDQDLNSLFTPCTERSLGDRFSSSRSTIVSLDFGEIGEVSLSILPRDCPESRSVPTINFISPITGKELIGEELGAVAEGQLGVESTCREGELFMTLTDPNLLSVDQERLVLFDGCIALSDDGISLQPLPAGLYKVEACAPIAESVRDGLEVSGCDTAEYWWGRASFTLNQVPTQDVEMVMIPTCECP